MGIFGVIGAAAGIGKALGLFGGGGSKSSGSSGGGDSLMFAALERLKRQRKQEEELARLKAATGPSATGRSL